MAFISKSRKQFRKKPTLSLAEDDEDNAQPIEKGVAENAAPTVKSAPRKAPSATLLSFDDDDPAALRAAPKRATTKGNADRKSGRAALRVPGLQDEHPPAVKVNTQVSGAGEYSRERLQQLAAATKKLPSAPDTFVLAGSFKSAAAPAPEDDRYAYNPTALVRCMPCTGLFAWCCCWKF